MPPQRPHVTGQNKSRLVESGSKIKVVVLHVTAISSKQLFDFVQAEAGELKVETEVFQFSEFESQKFFIPASVQSQSVVGEDVSTFLSFGQMLRKHTRHFR